MNEKRQHNHDFGQYTYDNQTPRKNVNQGKSFHKFIKYSTRSKTRSRIIFWTIFLFIVFLIIGVFKFLGFIWDLIF